MGPAQPPQIPFTSKPTHPKFDFPLSSKAILFADFNETHAYVMGHISITVANTWDHQLSKRHGLFWFMIDYPIDFGTALAFPGRKTVVKLISWQPGSKRGAEEGARCHWCPFQGTPPMTRRLSTRSTFSRFHHLPEAPHLHMGFGVTRIEHQVATGQRMGHDLS